MSTNEIKKRLATAALQLAAAYDEHEATGDDADPDENILVTGQITEGLMLSCGPAERRVLLSVIEAFEAADRDAPRRAAESPPRKGPLR